MTVSFQNVPQNIRVPLFYAEVNNSQANSAGDMNQRVLIIGQMTAAGTATPNQAQISTGVADAQSKYGLHSMIPAMVAGYRQNDSFGEVWCAGLQDPAGGASATNTLTITGTPTAAGTISLYIGAGGYWGDGTGLYQIGVTTVSTPATIATAIAAVINADPKAPVTATALAGVVTLTAVHAGAAGNEIDVRLNYLGSLGGQAVPAGLTVVIASPQCTGGTSAPALTALLDSLGDTTFDFIVCPFADTASLDALKQFLDDQTGRWSWAKQLYGHGYTALRGNLGALQTAGAARNDQHFTVLGFSDSPTPAWLIAAQMVGAIAQSIKNDPGRPVQTLPITGMYAPPVASRFELTDRNTLLYTGISTFYVDDAGTCHVENLITTYQKNAFGSPDNSYLEIETMYLLAYVLRFMKTQVTSKYARMKLAADGTRFAAGANIVTPSTLRAEVIASYQTLETNGYVQNSAAFAQNLIVEQNTTNPNRVDVLWPGTLINQLRIFALLAMFRL